MLLASICAVELCSVTRGGSIDASSAAVGLIAGTGLVAYWTRNLTVTVFCGCSACCYST